MGGSQAPMPYQPKHSGAVDDAYASTLAQNTAHTGMLWDYSKPKYEGLVDRAYNNPGDAGAMAGANDVSQKGNQAGNDMLSRGYQMAGLAPGAIQSGWDPQSANMNWGLGQTEGAAGVNAARSGLAGSPFGAGMANDAVGEFMRQWMAGAQGRQGEGVRQLGAINSGANDSMGQGLSTITNSALLPQAAFNDVTHERTNSMDAMIRALTGITSSSQANASGMDNYLNTGTNASNAATKATEANNATTTAMWSALGQVAGLGAAFIPKPH